MEGWESGLHQTKIAESRRGERAWDHGNIAESGFQVSGSGKSVVGQFEFALKGHGFSRAVRARHTSGFSR